MKSTYIFLALFLSASACGGGSDGGDKDDNDRYNPTNSTNSSQTNSSQTNSGQNQNVLTVPSAGRLLASQCAQCHGTDGISVSGIDSLAGESGEILEEMFEMKAENRNRVMHLQAKGYTDAQIREIATYFSSLYSGNGNVGGGYDNDGWDNDRDDDRKDCDKDRKKRKKHDDDDDHDDDRKKYDDDDRDNDKNKCDNDRDNDDNDRDGDDD